MGVAEIIAGIIKEEGLEGDAYFEETDSTMVSVLNAQPEQVKTSVSSGAGIRVVKEGCSAFGFVTSKDKGVIRETVLKLKENCLASGFEGYLFSRAAQAVLIKADDAEYFKAGPKRLLDAALEMEEAAVKYSPRIKYARDASVSAALTRTEYASTMGAAFTHSRSYYTAVISAIAYPENGTEPETSDYYMTSCALSEIDFKKTGITAAETAVKLLGSAPVKTGAYALIIPPVFACDFLALVSRMFLGSSVARGRSLMCGKKSGDRIASLELTIKDSPHLEMRPKSCGFDAEGTLTIDKPVIDKGIFRALLHDKKSASMMKEESTGNCVRADFRSAPECGPMNFYAEKGGCSVDALRGSMSGIYVTSLMGLHTADTVSGNYSLGITGFLYKNGRFIQPVRDAIASGNLSDMLLNVSCAADDLEFYGAFGSPTLVVENVMIAGK